MTSYSTSDDITLDVSSYTEFSEAKTNRSDLFDNISQQIATFPKTRYYGSKRRLLNWVFKELKDLPFNTVLDGFGGTASVSLLFKAMGKEVTFNDALMSNTISAKVLLAEELPLDLTEAYSFIDSIEPIEGFISNTFEGMYYTQEENNWLDGAANKIHMLEDELKRCIYLYSLFQACLMKRPFNLFHRANLNLRTNNNIKRSFGNYVTWEKPFSDLMKARLKGVFQLVSPSKHISHILQNGDVSKLDTGYDLVYLDPPYVNLRNKGDDYLMRYHFLEGLSDYKNWKNHISQESKIKSFNKNLYISEWQSKTTFKENLFNLIKKHNQSIVVLSYLANAYPAELEIIECFESNFQYVNVIRKDFCHALAKEKKIELLFIGRNK